MTLVVRILREDWADAAVPLPDYATAGAAGADLRANFPSPARAAGLVLAPQGRALVPTGLRMELPDGYEAQLRPRSGLALRHGITLANAPGTIDCDYRGAVGVILVNLGTDPVAVGHGDRIAQIVVAPVVRARFVAAQQLADTGRGTGGFGSTGKG